MPTENARRERQQKTFDRRVLVLIVWSIAMVLLVFWGQTRVTKKQNEIIRNQHFVIANQCIGLTARHIECKQLP